MKLSSIFTTREWKRIWMWSSDRARRRKMYNEPECTMSSGNSQLTIWAMMVRRTLLLFWRSPAFWSMLGFDFSSMMCSIIHLGHQVKDEPCDYIIRGTPGGVKYFGELEEHCFWGNEVKLYEHHVDKLFAMFWHKKPKIEYYVCTINKMFAKPGQRMYFQVEYTEDKLQKYIHEDDDTLPLKLGDGTVSCDSRFMLGTDKRATIMTNWSWFCHHTNIHEGDICAFHFKRKEGRRLSLTVHRL